jgi:hypothetical protein
MMSLVEGSHRQDRYPGDVHARSGKKGEAGLIGRKPLRID